MQSCGLKPKLEEHHITLWAGHPLHFSNSQHPVALALAICNVGIPITLVSTTPLAARLRQGKGGALTTPTEGLACQWGQGGLTTGYPGHSSAKGSCWGRACIVGGLFARCKRLLLHCSSAPRLGLPCHPCCRVCSPAPPAPDCDC